VSARGGARPARRRLLAAAVGALLALPLVVALTDAHLDGQSAALVLSTAAAALAVSALTLQPLLAGTGRIRRHRALGGVALALVLVHLGALYVESPEDTLFALSLDGPTRGRMAALATAALIAVVALGVLRTRLPMAGATWRILHGFLAALVIFLGFGHAVLTDGALDELGTPLLLGFGALALLGVGGAYAARRRRARS
jgi:predicted ferric reductase